MRLLFLFSLSACGGAIATKAGPSCTTPRCDEHFVGMSPINANGDDDGDGIPNNVDKAPLIPEDKNGFEDGDGIPDAQYMPKPATVVKGKKGEERVATGPASDVDKDGVPDIYDRCYDKAEDIDKFEDTDGCPDPDNDGDGIMDDKDKCPNVPGEKC